MFASVSIRSVVCLLDSAHFISCLETSSRTTVGPSPLTHPLSCAVQSFTYTGGGGGGGVFFKK